MLEDLMVRNYPATKIVRMRGNGPAPLVLIEIARVYQSIYDIKHCCGLQVEVKSLRKRNSIAICHRCRMYGHLPCNCNSSYKCMEWGEGLSAHLCAKPGSNPPKCANCGGEYLPISLRCPENPNNATNNRRKEKPYKL